MKKKTIIFYLVLACNILLWSYVAEQEPICFSNILTYFSAMAISYFFLIAITIRGYLKKDWLQFSAFGTHSLLPIGFILLA